MELRSFIESILGTYTPRTITVDGVIVPLQGIASLDWSYLFTAFILLIAVYCVFRAFMSVIARLF